MQHFEVLEPIEYCIFGEQRRAVAGNEVYIPVRSVAKELIRQKKIRLIGEKGVTLEEIANPPKITVPEEKIVLRVGSLIRVKDEEEIGTVLEILNKQVKVEYLSGESKRVSKQRIEEVLD